MRRTGREAGGAGPRGRGCEEPRLEPRCPACLGRRWSVLRGRERRFVLLPVGALLSSYGWYVLLACVAIYLIVQKISSRWGMRPSSQRGAAGADIGLYGAEGCVLILAVGFRVPAGGCSAV